MPLFPGILTSGLPDDSEAGIQKRNQASPASLYSVHFMDRYGGRSLLTMGTDLNEASDWGVRLQAYQDLNLPGFETQSQNPTVTDNYTGWASPIVTGRTPIPRDAVLDTNPGDPAHAAIHKAGLNEIMSFRHVLAPPRMHLVHTLDKLGNITGGGLNDQNGWRDTVQLLTYLPPVRISGAYYQSLDYDLGDVGTASPSGIPLQLVAGSGLEEGGGTAPDDLRLNSPDTGGITVADIDGSNTVDITGIDGFEYRMMVHLPGVGYQLSSKITGTTLTGLDDFTWVTSDDLGDAWREVGGPIFAALWAYPADRGAL